MDPRDFERLMAAVFENHGFDVTLTPKSKDGGCDLILLRNDILGETRTLVECKRYAEHRSVGVDIVRGLYGVVEERRATSGLIVATTRFTSGAVAFRESLKHRIELADYERLKGFLNSWKKG